MEVKGEASWRVSRTEAVTKPMIQLNASNLLRFLVFDVDAKNAAELVERSNLPDPTFFVENPSNGHAHVIYALEQPVSMSPRSRLAPMYLAAAIQRGFTRRLHADQSYVGLLAKTPFHPSWRTVAMPVPLYNASKLAGFLEQEEKRFWNKRDDALIMGIGRNCFLFGRVRQIAYRKVLTFKKEGKELAQFRVYLLSICVEVNESFSPPLPMSELRAVSRSIGKWVWQRFTAKELSQIQSRRGKKRWSKTPITMESVKPWEHDGISRRTWYDRRAKERRISDMAKVQQEE